MSQAQLGLHILGALSVGTSWAILASEGSMPVCRTPAWHQGSEKQNTAEPSPEIATEDLALQTEGIGALRHRDDIKLLGRNATWVNGRFLEEFWSWLLTLQEDLFATLHFSPRLAAEPEGQRISLAIFFGRFGFLSEWTGGGLFNVRGLWSPFFARGTWCCFWTEERPAFDMRCSNRPSLRKLAMIV